MASSEAYKDAVHLRTQTDCLVCRLSPWRENAMRFVKSTQHVYPISGVNGGSAKEVRKVTF